MGRGSQLQHAVQRRGVHAGARFGGVALLPAHPGLGHHAPQRPLEGPAHHGPTHRLERLPVLQPSARQGAIHVRPLQRSHAAAPLSVRARAGPAGAPGRGRLGLRAALRPRGHVALHVRGHARPRAPGPRPAHAPANGHRSRQRVRPAHQPLRPPGGRAVRGRRQHQRSHQSAPLEGRCQPLLRHAPWHGRRRLQVRGARQHHPPSHAVVPEPSQRRPRQRRLQRHCRRAAPARRRSERAARLQQRVAQRRHPAPLQPPHLARHLPHRAAPRASAALLLRQEGVRVGPLEREGAGAPHEALGPGAPRRRPLPRHFARPLQLGPLRAAHKAVVQKGAGSVQMHHRAHLRLRQAAHAVQQARDARRRLCVPHAALARVQHQRGAPDRGRPAAARPAQQHLAGGPDFDGVAQGRRCAVQLQVHHSARRQARTAQSLLQNALLRRPARGRQGARAAVLVDPTAHHGRRRRTRRPIRPLLRAPQAHRPARLPAAVPVRRRVQRLAPPVGCEHARLLEHHARVRGQRQVRARDQSRRTVLLPQALAGEVGAHQRRRARRVHAQGRPAPVERERKPPGCHAQRIARGSVRAHVQPVFAEEPSVVRTCDAHIHPLQARRPRRRRTASAALQEKHLRSRLHQQPVLRVHQRRLRLAQPQACGVETLDRPYEPPEVGPLGPGLPGQRLRVVAPVHRHAVPPHATGQVRLQSGPAAAEGAHRRPHPAPSPGRASRRPCRGRRRRPGLLPNRRRHSGGRLPKHIRPPGPAPDVDRRHLQPFGHEARHGLQRRIVEHQRRG